MKDELKSEIDKYFADIRKKIDKQRKTEKQNIYLMTSSPSDFHKNVLSNG